MCEIFEPEEISEQIVNQILTAIVDGMRMDRPNETRLAAVTALNNSLIFAEPNFKVAAQRDMLMQAICEATQCTHERVRVKAYDCMVTVAEQYYLELRPYASVLFQLTANAVCTDTELVALTAIEVWCTICDTEHNYYEENDDKCLSLMKEAQAGLVPILLHTLQKQPEDGDGDEWTVSNAGGMCLKLLAQVAKDDCVPKVVEFVTANIGGTNWRQKEAAVLALGSILEGPDPDKLRPLVSEAMRVLLPLLRDETNSMVKDTTAWTIAEICRLHHGALSSEMIVTLMEGIRVALSDPSAKVAAQACSIVYNLALACRSESDEPSNKLSQFMPSLLELLFKVASRPDEAGLRMSAYETVHELVGSAAADMKPVVVQVLLECLNRIEQSFAHHIGDEERIALQMALVPLVQISVNKLEGADIMNDQIAGGSPVADRIMKALLSIFTTKGAYDDAFYCIGDVANKTGEGFNRYLMAVMPPLVQFGLMNPAEGSVCSAAVVLVGDIANAVGKSISPFCQEIMTCLLKLAESDQLVQAVKPKVIEVFQDIALAIEGDFQLYTPAIVNLLRVAGSFPYPEDDDELCDYINTLRISVLGAYSGIIIGLRDGGASTLLQPEIPQIVNFVAQTGTNKNRCLETVKACCQLIGDLGQAFGPALKPFYNNNHDIVSIIQYALSQPDIKDVGKWTSQVYAVVIK